MHTEGDGDKEGRQTRKECKGVRCFCWEHGRSKMEKRRERKPKNTLQSMAEGSHHVRA